MSRIPRLRRLVRDRLSSAAEGLTPTSRTALRELFDRAPPPPSAFAAFGEGSWIVPPSSVAGAGRIDIGRGVVILELSSLEAAPGGCISVGDGARLARCVHISALSSVTIGSSVSTSDYVAIIDSWGPGPLPAGMVRTPAVPARPVVIEHGAYLGCGSVIGPGTTVGTGAFVGEGAVVVDDVEPWTVVYGNPAVPVRRLTSSGSWEGRRFG